jgi:hypothetical protein
MRIRHAFLLAAAAAAAHAADDATIAAPGALKADGQDGRWSHAGRIGAFYANVATNDAATSRDATVASAHASTSYLLTGDLLLLYRKSAFSLDQTVRLRYGRIRTEGQPWIENNDEVHYDGVARDEFSAPHFIYGAWGGDSVFTSPVDRQPLDPVTARVSAGYGQLYRGVLFKGTDAAKPDVGRDRLEARVGVRAQKRWSEHDLPSQDRIESGPEGFLRYDKPVDPTLRWYVQYEVFSEFHDLGHIQQLLTAGLTAQLSKWVAADLSLRAYRESKPDRVPSGTPGYDRWGLRTDTLLGLTVLF